LLALLGASPEAWAISLGRERALAPYHPGLSVDLHSAAVAATDTHLFVAWEEVATDDSVEGLALLTFDAEGQVVGEGPRWLNLGVPPERGISLARWGQGFVAAWLCDTPARLCVRRGDATTLEAGSTVTSNVDVQGTPALASTGAVVMVAWADTQATAEPNTRGCVLDGALTCGPADGVALDPQLTSGQGTVRATVSSATGDFVGGWYDTRGGASNIFLQRLSAAGALVGTSRGLGCCPAGAARLALAYQPMHGHWLAWEDAYDNIALRVRALDESLGFTLGSAEEVTLPGADGVDPWLAWDEGRDVLVITWRNPDTNTIESRERAADGVWSDVTPVATGSRARVALAPDGRGVLAYQRPEGSVTRTYVRLLGPIPDLPESYLVGCGCGVGQAGAAPLPLLVVLGGYAGRKRRPGQRGLSSRSPPM
jgi:MYXO-CTERM domain-containing protein